MKRLVCFLLAPTISILGCNNQTPQSPNPDDSGACSMGSRPFILVNDDDDDGNGFPDLADVGTSDADLLELRILERFDLRRDDVAVFNLTWLPATEIRIWTDEERATQLVNGRDVLGPEAPPVIWVEGLAPGTVQLTLKTGGNSSNDASHSLDLDVIDVDILRYDDSEVRSFIPVYRPNPTLRVPDITAEQVEGDRFVIPKRACVASDLITFVAKVEFFNSDDRDSGWRTVPIADAPPPDGFGKPHESTFATSFVLTGLDALRRSGLGTRRRYLFRATNAIGRSAYEELILEVRLDSATGAPILNPINLMAPPEIVQPTVPAHSVHRLNLKPAPSIAGTALVLDANSPFHSTIYPDGTTEIGGQDLKGPIEFVVIDGADMVLRTANPQRHFIPHFRTQAGTQAIRATYETSDMPSCRKKAIDVAAADYGLHVSLTDDDLEDIVPVTVRRLDSAVTVTTANVDRYKFLMRPFRFIMPEPPEPFASVSQAGNVARLEIEGDRESVRIWSTSSQDGSGWQPLDLPAEFVFASIGPIGNAVTRESLSMRRFLIEGDRAESEVFLSLSVRNGDTLIAEDRVRLVVRSFSGVAGQRLEQFPHIRFARTYNEHNDAGIADTIAVALDPTFWPHLSAHYSLDAPPTANVQIVPHRSPGEWAADNTLEGPAARIVRLDGHSIASSIEEIGQVSRPGAYDVVFDLSNAAGIAVANGRLDPGDIIGILTDDERKAEVQVVADPLGPAAQTSYVGWIEYGSVNNVADRFVIPADTDQNPDAVTDNFVHGLIYYPAANASGAGVPSADGVCPLVVLLHGNHVPRRWLTELVESNSLTLEQAEAITSAENYVGFVYLQYFLATKGYVSVSVDLDRYFGSEPPFAWPGEAIRARAFCAVMNIDRVRALNQPQSGSPISQRIDFDDITLMGHSKGGEAVVECCEYRGSNDNPSPTGPFAQVAPFPITRVISVAPSRKHDGTVGDRPHLILHGAADGDEWPATGFQQYDMATGRKAMLFIDGANHNFFNSSWPYSDATQKPNNDTANIDPMVPPVGDPATLTDRPYQQDLLKAYVFAWLQGGPYLPYFSRVPERIRPPTLAFRSIHQQYRDRPETTRVLDDFETENTIGASSSGGEVLGSGFQIFRERILFSATDHYYNATRAVELSWDLPDGSAIYTQIPSAGTLDASPYRFLSFRIGPYFEEKAPLALTVEIRDGNGGAAYINTSALSLIGVPYAATGIDVPAPLFAPANMTRTMFRTFRLELKALQADGRRLDLTRIASLRFIFDQSTEAGTKGRIVIDDIEFTN